MLRVCSVLYLQNVWTRPLILDVCVVEQEEVIANSIIQRQLSQETVLTREDATIVEEDETMELVEEEEMMIPSNEEQALSIEREDSLLIIQEEENQAINEANITSSSSDSSVHTQASILPDRSETPMTHHDREYYDDDVVFSEDEEEEEAVHKMSKFSPKQILHRAKSSITEESVKKLGRRTSLFLDKINASSKKDAVPSLPMLPPTVQGLRRQSSKLTTKGKTFTRKLKKAISFHHA